MEFKIIVNQEKFKEYQDKIDNFDRADSSALENAEQLYDNLIKEMEENPGRFIHLQCITQ